MTVSAGDSKVTTQIRAVILDYGEVLCHLPSPQAIEDFARMFKMDAKSFFPTYLQSRGAYDKGDLLAEEYWRKFAADAGVPVDLQTIEQFRQIDLKIWSTVNQAMVRWLQGIHAAGYKTAILSNMPLDMIAHIEKQFSWLVDFDQRVFSAGVRSVKPEPEIYRHTLEVLRVQPQEALFIDDREINLEPARAMGMQTIRFQSVEQLSRDLQVLGFPILPRETD